MTKMEMRGALKGTSSTVRAVAPYNSSFIKLYCVKVHVVVFFFREIIITQATKQKMLQGVDAVLYTGYNCVPSAILWKSITIVRLDTSSLE